MVIILAIGLKVLRGMFFDNMQKVWYKRMPYAEILIIVVDAMAYARNEGDLVKEELLWYFLLDVWRNPEKLKDLTDDYVNNRLKLIKERLNAKDEEEEEKK